MAQRTVIQDFYPNGNMSKVNVQSEVWEDTSQRKETRTENMQISHVSNISELMIEASHEVMAVRME